MNSELVYRIPGHRHTVASRHLHRAEAFRQKIHADPIKICCQFRLSNDDFAHLDVHRNARSRAQKRPRIQKCKVQKAEWPLPDRARATPSPGPQMVDSAQFRGFCRRAGECEYELDTRDAWKTNLLPSPPQEMLSASPNGAASSKTTKVFEEARRLALATHQVKLGQISAAQPASIHLPPEDLVFSHRPLAGVVREAESPIRNVSPSIEPMRFSTRLQDRNTLLVIRGLRYGTKEKHLRAAFSKFGEVKIVLPRDYITKKPREFAFLTFDTVKNAQTAFTAMNMQKIGRPPAPIEILWGHQRRAQSPIEQINQLTTSLSGEFGSTVNSWPQTSRSSCQTPVQLSNTVKLDPVEDVLLSPPLSPSLEVASSANVENNIKLR